MNKSPLRIFVRQLSQFRFASPTQNSRLICVPFSYRNQLHSSSRNFTTHFHTLSVCQQQKNTMGTGRSKLEINKDATDGASGTTSQSEIPQEEIVADVCSESDLQDGEMKEFVVGKKDEKILLVKENGQFYAVGAKCTHYGAPLAKGTLSNGKIICPWHGACFNSCTGDIEDHPGLDSLPKYRLNIEEGRVKVIAEKAMLKSNKRIRRPIQKIGSTDQVVLVIGGGGAAASCVEEMHYQGFEGRIIMATQEEFLPYDRPKLSKALSSTGHQLALRSQEFYKNIGVEVLLNKKAIDVNVTDKEVKFNDDSTISYDKLVLATGGTPRKHQAPGNELKNVCYLRSPNDGNLIAQNAKGKNVVIIGNSFIGMEVAAYFSGKAKSISIVARSAIPFKYSLGPDIGLRMRKLFETKEDIKFYDDCTVKEFSGNDDGELTGVVLEDGNVIDADVCVVGIGVVPSTDFIKSSGIAINDKQQVIVDDYLKTSVDEVYAAGDIVQFPLCIFDCKVNIGHWQLASYHGKVAACNAVGKEMKVNTVPYFWCMLFGKSLRFCGYNNGYTDTIIDGDLEELKFAVYYIKDDVVVGVAAMNMDPVCSDFSAHLRAGKTLTADQLRNNLKDWMK